jgi:predicted Zn-dependent protease
MMSTRRTGPIFQLLVGWAAAAVLSVGCATNPATGKKQISLIGEQQEIAIGEEAQEEVELAFGFYDSPGLQDYVQEVGETLASSSERPHLPWTFRVVDDPIVNAFAYPGGYIYISRGILAHFNSEAELAGVLGHEIGHVTARHSVNQMSKQQLMGIGLGVGMILSPEFRQVGDLAQTGLGLLLLKYSRDDERQSDELGLRYSVRSGYDAREMAHVYDILDDVSQQAEGGPVPGWLSTHPAPENRGQLIDEQLADADVDWSGKTVGRDSYLRRLDGLVYGDNPREGYFDGDTFYHPDLGFKMNFPAGWKNKNLKEAVVGTSSGQDARIVLVLAMENDPPSAVRAYVNQHSLNADRIKTGTINGHPAAWARIRDQTQLDRPIGRVASIRHRNQTFLLLGFTTSDQWNRYSDEIDHSLQSFDTVKDPAILNVQAQRISIVQVDREMTMREFDARYPSGIPLEQIALINQVGPEDLLRKGQLVKRVTPRKGK